MVQNQKKIGVLWYQSLNVTPGYFRDVNITQTVCSDSTISDFSTIMYYFKVLKPFSETKNHVIIIIYRV